MSDVRDDGAQRFFDAIAGRYDRVYGLDRDASRRRMARVLGVIQAAQTPPARVLDLGVGTGRELSALQDAGYEPVGVDISPRMLEQCARRTRPVTLVQADLWGPLPFANASFAAVVALHGTLSHPPDALAPRRLAREVARVLVGGGIFAFEVPAPAWVARIDEGHGAASRDGAMHVTRVDARTCVHEDHVAGVAIAATVRSGDEWAALLAPELVAKSETFDGVELFVVAHTLR